jgi:hypothetical protein
MATSFSFWQILDRYLQTSVFFGIILVFSKNLTKFAKKIETIHQH